MNRKRFKAEEIVNKLREADVHLSKGQTVAQACKRIGVTDRTYYRWRKEFGGMKTNQAKRLKELERENGRLNGYVESFNGKLRDELLNGEIFYTLKEAKVLIESWRVHYNTVRPHSALGYRPPAPEVVTTNRSAAGSATLVPRFAPPAAGQGSMVRLT